MLNKSLYCGPPQSRPSHGEPGQGVAALVTTSRPSTLTTHNAAIYTHSLTTKNGSSSVMSSYGETMTSRLPPVVMGDSSQDTGDMGECGDIDLDTLTAMLDEDGMGEPEDEAVSGCSDPEPSTLNDLGLVLSDEEEEDHPAPSSSTPASAFSAAFSQSKFSKAPSGKDDSGTTPVIDPLESELREMEARVRLLRENLAKKKKLESCDSISFTKLTTTPDQTRRTNSRTLSASEELALRKNLKRKSELHSGDTDSEDEEDNRTPMEQRYNSNGRDIKRRIAHESKVQASGRIEKALSSNNKSVSAADKPGWKAGEGALVSIGRSGGRTSGATTSHLTDENVTLDAYSGIRIINPLVSQQAMRERMEGRRMVRLSTIKLHLRGGEIEGDWATIAVLVAKGNPKDSQKGSKYCIWKLSDLSDCTKTAAFFLFGSAYKALWKHSVGTVFGVLNPKIMKDKYEQDFVEVFS
ncbi:Protein MCM10 [Portunus trituberculatus]|uniref:Protein MCM10 n=1 Tax=Portunus trituberculatus TaxID=210409 RepID=A0A5B7DG18_PORTR|nr:Protein MCM10 [Portunus trituberculatus]